MAEAISVSEPLEGAEHKILQLETGKLAGQADGAVTVRLGETMLLVTATANRNVREGIDFFPLTVDIEERMYAAGKIPGSFFRREGRASDQAILTCRLIDRPLRPSFPDGYRNETHVVGTVLAADQVNPHDVPAIVGASAALTLSGIPFEGPIGAVRIAWSAEGDWIPFPTFSEGEESAFEMVVAGRVLPDGDVAVMMVEAGGTEAAWEAFASDTPKVNEAVIAEGLEASKTWIRQTVRLQEELVAAAGGKREIIDYDVQVDYRDDIAAAVEAAGRDRIAATQQIADKAERGAAEKAVREELLAELAPQFAEVADAAKQLKSAIKALTKQLVRRRIVDEGIRIDGRGPRDLRAVSAEVGVLPAVHGSGLFQRGETQVLNAATLGMPRMEQMLDTITVADRKRYMHHYNFPPYSTGEAAFMRGPKRREIGHGMLAERALAPVIPPSSEFPYTIRTVSDVLSSNGSTSMGSVCASTLSLMDAGVPIKAPVAGIAMGLIKEGDAYITLTDILGAEDAFGDMDFKVAGTEEFVTALQLDTKIDGIPADVLAAALEQAKEARLAILSVMRDTLPEPRPEVGPTAPKIISFEIPLDKIGEVIGPKGKVINAIQQETGADISVDDDGIVGTVSIGSSDSGAVSEAERQIRLILNPPTADVGATYNGRVVNITKFGAFVNILPGRDGLLHISKMGGGKRIDRVEDLYQLGDEVVVRVDDVDQNGKVSLSLGGEQAGDAGGPAESGGSGGGGRARTERRGGDDDAEGGSEAREYVSFEDEFEGEVRESFGDLGPAGGGGGGEGRSDRSGGRGGGDRRRRRR